jgi:hypothetical protein
MTTYQVSMPADVLKTINLLMWFLEEEAQHHPAINDVDWDAWCRQPCGTSAH